MIRRRDLPAHAAERRLIEGHGTGEAQWHAPALLHELASCDVAGWAERHRRIWLLAPHPDDEMLALGGSLAQLSALGADLCIVSVTDGEASHADSANWTPARLAVTRPAEMQHSLDAMGVAAEVMRLGLPDGRVGAHRERMLHALVEQVEEGDLLLATCCFDGHPDHEACGDVAVLVAELTGATVIHYPVWMWHWATPDERAIPWKRAQRIAIPEQLVARKRSAIERFVSQIEPDGAREAVLPPYVLPRFLRPYEVVFL